VRTLTLQNWFREAPMSRKLRVLVALLLVSLAYTAAACADAAGPQVPHVNACDTNGADVC